MFVKPAIAGAKVPFPHPSKRFLSPDGEEVPDADIHWARRLAHKDVVLASPAKPAPAPAAAPSPAAPSPPASAGASGT